MMGNAQRENALGNVAPSAAEAKAGMIVTGSSFSGTNAPMKAPRQPERADQVQLFSLELVMR